MLPASHVLISPLIYVYNPDVEGGKERLTDKESISQSKSTSMAAQSDYVLTYINQFGDHGLTLTAVLLRIIMNILIYRVAAVNCQVMVFPLAKI